MTTRQTQHRDVIEAPERHMRIAYLAVVLIEIAVLLALWTFSRTFSGS